jgi:hypothetical protein
MNIKYVAIFCIFLVLVVICIVKIFHKYEPFDSGFDSGFDFEFGLSPNKNTKRFITEEEFEPEEDFGDVTREPYPITNVQYYSDPY